MATWRHQRRPAVSPQCQRSCCSPARVDGLDHREFEYLIRDLMIRDGADKVRRVGGAGDNGADVVAVDPTGKRWIIQCKHRKQGLSGAPMGVREWDGQAHHYTEEQLRTWLENCGPRPVRAARSTRSALNESRPGSSSGEGHEPFHPSAPASGSSWSLCGLRGQHALRLGEAVHVLCEQPSVRGVRIQSGAVRSWLCLSGASGPAGGARRGCPTRSAAGASVRRPRPPRPRPKGGSRPGRCGRPW
ncbi:restriction endonuclease [Streptomyces rochei]|uniref:restriction endonuclease n=1 Tax=Streptomyces rochei TaxID=1928 RepID=UPI0036320612